MCIEEELEARRGQGGLDRGEDKDSARHHDDDSTMYINRLPRTTLARIFRHLRDEYVYRRCYQSSTTTDGAVVHGGHPHLTKPYSWLYITLVCRRWRNTAYTHSPLWTFVDLAYDKETVRSLLILSNNEPLCIHWDSSSPSSPATTTGNSRDVSRVVDVGELAIKLDLIMDEQTWFKELDLTFSSNKLINLFPWKQFTSFPARRLTKLVLKATRGDIKEKGKGKDEIKPELRVLPALGETNFPELRELGLDGLHPKWGETCLPKLWRLELRNVLSDCVGEAEGDGDGTGPGDFVGFLSRCGGLRSLMIDGLSIRGRI